MTTRYKRHPHGGAYGWTQAGESRGVKKVRGEKKPEIGHVSPAEKLERKRQARDSYLRYYSGR